MIDWASSPSALTDTQGRPAAAVTTNGGETSCSVWPGLLWLTDISFVGPATSLKFYTGNSTKSVDIFAIVHSLSCPKLARGEYIKADTPSLLLVQGPRITEPSIALLLRLLGPNLGNLIWSSCQLAGLDSPRLPPNLLFIPWILIQKFFFSFFPYFLFFSPLNIKQWMPQIEQSIRWVRNFKKEEKDIKKSKQVLVTMWNISKL